MKKNILVVDDSALMRRVTSDIINADERFCVTDFAKNGFEAVDLILKNYGKYAAVVLDINMPRMSGLEVLEQLNKSKININIIISSTVAVEGAAETIKALELGAFDFVTKPTTFSVAKNSDFGQRLLQSISVATSTDVSIDKKIANKTTEKKVSEPKVSVSNQTIIKSKEAKDVSTKNGQKLVFIASSTGGPRSLHQVIPYIPKNIDAPVVLVQHMPKGFTKSLANRLDELSHITVTEAKNGDILEKGHVYIAPGGMHLKIEGDSPNKMKCNVYMDEYINGLRPCADVTLESLQGSPFDEIICVVLTGMGSDATKGIIKLNETNSIYTISQDEESCIVYGMPRAIAEAGMSDEVLPLSKIAMSILNHTGVQKNGCKSIS